MSRTPISKEKVAEIRRRRANLEPIRDIAKDLGVSPGTVSRYGRRLRKRKTAVVAVSAAAQTMAEAPDGVIAWLSRMTTQGQRIEQLRQELDELVQHALAIQELLNEASE